MGKDFEKKKKKVILVKLLTVYLEIGIGIFERCLDDLGKSFGDFDRDLGLRIKK